MPEPKDVLTINITAEGDVHIQGNVAQICETLKTNVSSVFAFIQAMRALDAEASDRVYMSRGEYETKNSICVELNELKRLHTIQSQELDAAKNVIQELEHKARG